MRRLILLVAAIMAVTGFAASANGGVRNHYSHAYYSAADRCGGRDQVGRNVRRNNDTLAGGTTVGRAKYRELTSMLDLMCRPEPRTVAAVATAPTRQASTSSTQVSVSNTATAPPHAAANTGSCPQVIPGYIIQRESGGNPNARNPSGAFGCYQLMPEHFQSGGACAGLSTDVAGQAQCATRLWNGGAGSSNWAQTR